MAFIKLLLIFINIFTVAMTKPVAARLWPERCTRNSIALNDCNWCWCDNQNQYACKARVCRDIDVFGHFNDAIREMEPGIQGHGAWRTSKVACEAGVHYRKNDLLCVCTEDGFWPNPVCRDKFQVLHTVEVTNYTRPSLHQDCTPEKLHLIGCNVCICPPSGAINPEYCTKRQCDVESIDVLPEKVKDSINEVYVDCQPDHKYKLGCRTCVCLRNNRLLCENCTTEESHSMMKVTLRDSALRKQYTVCPEGEKKVFKVNCNYCFCNENGFIICTIKNCLPPGGRIAIKFLPNKQLKLVDKPLDEEECEPFTTYKKDCNTCDCLLAENNLKVVRCTVKQCSSSPDSLIHNCVAGTIYKKNCFICRCTKKNGEMWEVCYKDKDCVNDESREMESLDSMQGYCEPLHTYIKDCNKCKCSADGKTVSCTSKICPKTDRVTRPAVINVLPVIQKLDVCPEGHSYKVDCNYCFCMKHGDAVCTMMECGNEID